MLCLFAPTLIAANIMQVLSEEKAFQDELATMSPEERQAATKRRDDFLAEQQRQREHAELVEAIKPHTLWSFIGLGKK